MRHTIFTCALVMLTAMGCTTTPVVDHCSGSLGNTLTTAMSNAESRLSQGCEYHFNGYFTQLLDVADANPDTDNKRLFSDHLVRVKDMGVISTRQAQGLYNRYFNVKFVSLSGDYNTCSQTCPMQGQVIANMKQELQDKELGLLRVSGDQPSYYRADNLLKEAQLVLEATCRACEAGGAQ